MLYLNTQRPTLPFENGHGIHEADYYLRHIHSSQKDYYATDVAPEALLNEVYRTDALVLYEVRKAD